VATEFRYKNGSMGNQWADRELFEACVAGDEGAWLEVQGFVFRHLRFKLRNEERAGEFTQRILLLLLERDRNGVLNLTKVRDPERFRSFLRAFTFSRMIDFIRSEGRRRHEDIDSETVLLPMRPSVDVHGEVLEELEMLFRAIDQLKEPCRTILKQDIYFKVGLTEHESYGDLFAALAAMDEVRSKRKGNYTLDKFYVDLHRCKKYLQRYL
jgi:DNA-directed RNA polymerase specialized sigma24 family protein